ncbi:MAG: ATP-binding protein [Pirellulales bacterium]
MEVVTVAEKLHDLETWLIESLGQDSARARLTSVRKAAEALCKVILLNHCGHETGSRVIQGHEELDGSPGQGQPRSLSDLVQLVCKSGAQITPPIPDSIARRQVYTRLEMVRTHTNPASHDPDNSTNSTPDSPDEVIGIVLPPLALTVNWMYRFIQRTLPPEIQEILKPLLPDSPTGLESFEDLRGIDVVRLYYPNQRIVSHRSQSDWKEKVSYEYVAVEVARQNVVGFLFLKRHITIHKSLAHFASSLDHDLANIFICSPNVVSRDTGREVDRLKSIQEQYASLGSSKLPEKPELYYIRDFLWQYCLSKHASELTLPFTSAEPFVDQELYRIDSSDAPHPLDCDSLEHSTQLINATEAEEPVVLIAGPAGVGKSTFCEHLAQRINSLDKKRAILISSTDLRDAMPDSPITSVSARTCSTHG